MGSFLKNNIAFDGIQGVIFSGGQTLDGINGESKTYKIIKH
jgi:hypothetical protein